MSSHAQLKPIDLANFKADPSSFSGEVNSGAYRIQNAAWPFLYLGLRDGADVEGNPVDTIREFQPDQAPVVSNCVSLLS